MDRINSANPPSYPINKAISAYAKTPHVNKPGGVPYAAQVTGVRRSDQVNAPSTDPIQTQPTRQSDAVARISPSPMIQRANAIAGLVGAKVEPINLSSDVASVQGPKPAMTSAGTYTMYPQAADRVQAATNLATNTGRGLDIRG
jgi:hypothetical protein